MNCLRRVLNALSMGKVKSITKEEGEMAVGGMFNPGY
ncbi:hypothetical protein Ct9H90mP29_20290 [bacterium]|nr:MAG: hypothetical protein Ct9H90mP29_20290 [bacterium]